MKWYVVETIVTGAILVVGIAFCSGYLCAMYWTQKELKKGGGK